MFLRQIAFVDAQGWMAIVNRRDQCHCAAAEAYKSLGVLNWSLYTSNWAIYDALSHVRERDKNGGLKAAQDLNKVLRDKRIIVFPVSSSIEERAVKLFWTTEDKSWSISVCANLQIIADAEIRYILSATKAYEEARLIRLIRQDPSGKYFYFAPN